MRFALRQCSKISMIAAKVFRFYFANPYAAGNALTKTMQATSDATGGAGLNAVLVGAVRKWTYSYNSVGQLLTVTGPRSDVADITRYDYDAQGNLSAVTNAANQVTTLTNYDANGRVGRVVEPNNLVTELTYSPRGWLSARTVGGQLTSYEYDGAGQLRRVISPDNSVVTYSYDDAHRLIGISDSLGNSISYKLDLTGNRMLVQANDPGARLSRQTARIFDTLNQLTKQTGGAL